MQAAAEASLRAIEAHFCGELAGKRHKFSAAGKQWRDVQPWHRNSLAWAVA